MYFWYLQANASDVLTGNWRICQCWEQPGIRSSLFCAFAFVVDHFDHVKHYILSLSAVSMLLALARRTLTDLHATS